MTKFRDGDYVYFNINGKNHEGIITKSKLTCSHLRRGFYLVLDSATNEELVIHESVHNMTVDEKVTFT
jgi:hypothetical protein